MRSLILARSVMSAIALAAAACTSAHAEVVVFTNTDNSFAWMFRAEATPGSAPGEWLDVTLPAAAQTGAASTRSILYSYMIPFSSSGPASDRIRGTYDPGDAQLAQAPTVIITAPGHAGEFPYQPPLAMSQGQTVGPALNFQDYGDVFVRWLGPHLYQHFLPDHTFIGLRILLPDGAHYAWVELGPVPGTSSSQPWRPMRWAYETTPNTPIILPALTPPPPPCYDLNGDGVVGSADLGILLGSWGTDGIADLNNDNIVNSTDLAAMLGSWGECA